MTSIEVIKFQSLEEAEDGAMIIQHGRMRDQYLRFINTADDEGVAIDSQYIQDIFGAEKGFFEYSVSDALEVYSLLGETPEGKLALDIRSSTESYGHPLTMDGHENCLLMPMEGLDRYANLPTYEIIEIEIE